MGVKYLISNKTKSKSMSIRSTSTSKSFVIAWLEMSIKINVGLFSAISIIILSFWRSFNSHGSYHIREEIQNSHEQNTYKFKLYKS